MPLTLSALESWADLLIRAFAGCGPGDGALVRLVRPADVVLVDGDDGDDGGGELELGLLRLDGAHPCDVLARLDVDVGAGGELLALGVASGGWAAPLDPVTAAGGRASAHPDAERIVQVVVVSRGGEVAARVRFPDGVVLSAPPSEGQVLDALRAALGVVAM